MRALLSGVLGRDSSFAREPLGLAMGLAIVLIWSAWYVVSRWGVLGNMTPADITFVRYLVGTLLTLPMFWWWRGREIPWRVLPLLVFTYGFPYALTLFMSLEHMPVANTGLLLNGLLPVVNAALAWVFFRQLVGLVKWVAIAVLAASNLLMLGASLGAQEVTAGWLWILAPTLLLGLYLSAIRKWPVDMVVLIPAMSLGNFLLFLPFWYFLPTNLAEATAGEILVQAVFNGFVNQVGVVWMISFTVSRIGSVSTSVLYGLVPSVTALLGWLLLGEAIGVVEVVAVAGCTAGIMAFARSR